MLVVYFSTSGHTKQVAEATAQLLQAPLYAITPAQPYTEEDLADADTARTRVEQDNPNLRPAILGKVEQMADYEVVFLGYPIWKGQSPRIISTFLESYDFTNKIIVPFCTSYSSPIGDSDLKLHAFAPLAGWLEGMRFAPGSDSGAVDYWLHHLTLSPN